MSGFYNMLNGYGPECVFFAPMLTDTAPDSFFPRFRDCFINEDKIIIFTRVGGPNRSDNFDNKEDSFGEEKLYEMPTFIETYDDEFDSTYGYYVFGVPEEWQDDYNCLIEGRFTEISDAYKEHLIKCFPVLKDILEELLQEMKKVYAEKAEEK